VSRCPDAAAALRCAGSFAQPKRQHEGFKQPFARWGRRR
jgi:hypothetical protein